MGVVSPNSEEGPWQLQKVNVLVCSYAGSRSGHVFEVDYRKVAIRHVRRLQPVTTKDKATSG